MSRKTLYRDDLAYVHHVGFGGFAREASTGLLRLLHGAGIRRGTLVDLGCGSGVWAREAGRRGFDVVGVDASPAMIRLARRVAPRARFRCASLYDFDIPACDVVTAIGEGLNYVAGEGHRLPELDRLFRRIAVALRPDGLFIFDVMLRGGAAMNYRDWRAGGDWAVLVEVTEESAHDGLTRSITTFRRVKGSWRRAEETHRIRLYSRVGIERSLRAAGFAVRTARGYGGLALAPRRLAFLARRRA